MMYEQEEIFYDRPLPDNYEEVQRFQMQSYYNSKFRAAVAYGDIEEINEILEQGADLHARGPNGASIIYLAIRKGRYEVAEYLLSVGADPNDSVEFEGLFSGYTPLNLACREREWEFAKILLTKYQADVNIKAEDGSLPIHYVVVKENLEMLQLLLDCGANVNVIFFEKLFKKLFVYKTWSDKYKNYSLLAHAILQKNLSLMKLLIDNGAESCPISENKVPLFYAIESDDPEIVKFLVEKIKDQVDIKTYLKKITIRGFQPIQYAVLKENTRIVEVLLEAGADANAEIKRVHYTKYLGWKSWTRKNSNQISLLSHAISKNDTEMSRILSKFGAE